VPCAAAHARREPLGSPSSPVTEIRFASRGRAPTVAR
jgi:hypothetical protein